MNSPPEGTWAPSPELLAAYFDGEFEGRDELTPMRRRLEDWLVSNPEARAEFTQCRRLKQLWLETTPPDPGQAVWWHVLDEMERRKDEDGLRTNEKAKVPAYYSFLKKALVACTACFLATIFLLLVSSLAR